MRRPPGGHATLYFYRGRELDDGSGLLEGGGKDMRFITIRKPVDVVRPGSSGWCERRSSSVVELADASPIPLGSKSGDPCLPVALSHLGVTHRVGFDIRVVLPVAPAQSESRELGTPQIGRAHV